ncbi:hypothetical protein [Paenibacillus arenosi]|uniref:Uncharacterized protein n=1 Tax=Paenibacillus arenosi TaxID=2774142 RepID=A0ABR9AXJ9_9BACL|nr:hypothetical protein [Paenibacillus arenosi]MBD8498864.1 hypothetical protein [Paenibacillus arenosi]
MKADRFELEQSLDTYEGLQQEVIFLRSQNEAIFQILSFLTVKNGGKLVVPHDFGLQAEGFSYSCNRNEKGDYVMSAV